MEVEDMAAVAAEVAVVELVLMAGEEVVVEVEEEEEPVVGLGILHASTVASRNCASVSVCRIR